jgi:uncharacterized protein with gpF-like domain
MPRPPGGVPGQIGTLSGPFPAFGCSPRFRAAVPHALLTESCEPDHKEKDMTDKENEITDKEKDTADTAEKPISDSKEELTEAELDQVAGGGGSSPGRLK